MRMPVFDNNFDLEGGINAARAGRRDGLEIKRHNDVQTLGQHLAAGRDDQAATHALNNGMINEGMKIRQQSREREMLAAKQKVDNLAKMVYAADTPEKWGHMINRLQSTGAKIPKQYYDFGSRDLALAEYMDMAGLRGVRKDQRDAQEYNLKMQGYRLDNRKKLRDLETVGQAPEFKIPSGYMRSSDGRGVVPIPNGPKDPNSDSRIFSDGQMKSASFAKRMMDADKIMLKLETGDSKKGTRGYEYGGRQYAADWLGNWVNTNEGQSYKQAQEDWVRAKLRRESGAAIGKDEMAQEIDLYFPKYGDSKETIKQKRRARAQATRNLLMESQGAYNRIYKGAAAGRISPRKRAQDANGNVIELNPETNQWEPVR